MDDSQKKDQIIAECQKGNEKAFEELIDLYASRCYGYFYKLSRNSATSNDLLSELYVRLFRKITSFRGGSFDRWLFTIASNIFNDYLRRQYRHRKMLDTKVRELEAVKPQASSEQEMIEKMQIQMSKLDNDTAQLLTMRFYGQLSFKELAEIRGEPIGTTLSKVHRGLKKLRELMGDESV